jgi:hypothetical protein
LLPAILELWLCGWYECGHSPQKANHNSKIAGEGWACQVGGHSGH